MTIFNRRRKADSVATRKSKTAEAVKATQDVRQVTRENPEGLHEWQRCARTLSLFFQKPGFRQQRRNSETTVFALATASRCHKEKLRSGQ